MKLLELFVSVLCAAVASLITWAFTRKRHKVETDKVELDLIQMWKSIADDLRVEVSRLSQQVEQLTRENIALKEEMKRFEKMIKQKIDKS